MTVLVAVIAHDGLWIGADTAVFSNDTCLPEIRQKWCTIDGMWFACSGDAVNLAEVAAQYVEDEEEGLPYLRLVRARRAALRVLKERNDQVCEKPNPGAMLIAHKGAISSIDSIGGHSEHSPYMAAGSGREIALGALHALLAVPRGGAAPLGGCTLVEAAIAAACAHNAWCRGMWIHRVED